MYIFLLFHGSEILPKVLSHSRDDSGVLRKNVFRGRRTSRRITERGAAGLQVWGGGSTTVHNLNRLGVFQFSNGRCVTERGLICISPLFYRLRKQA